MNAFPSSGPAWPVDGWISPTALKSYNRCPHRVRLRYLEKVPEPKTFSVQLSKGRITHDLLAMSAKRIVQGLGDFSDDWFYETAYRRLPHWEFPSNAARASHAREIADWVGWVLRYLDRTAIYLRIEKGDRRDLAWDASGARLTLATRPDLVLLRTDDAGEPYIDFIDYKTGRQGPDDLVPVFMRYALTGYLRTVVPIPRRSRCGSPGSGWRRAKSTLRISPSTPPWRPGPRSSPTSSG